MNKYIVALKLKGKISSMSFQSYSYLKAKKIDFEEFKYARDSILPCPIKKSPYVSCNLITSPVVNYKKCRDGWEVETENSTYHFLILDMNEINKLVDENNFSGPKATLNSAMYWC